MSVRQTAGWGSRFLALLEAGGRDGRLRRGRSAQIHDLTVRPGCVEGRVRRSGRRPYEVRIHLAPAAPADWERIIEIMAGQAGFAAALLAGGLGPEVEQAFAEAGVPLLPDLAQGLAASCTCPDRGTRCKHVAALCRRLADALDGDPALLLALRGRSRDALLAELRNRRAGPPAERPPDPPGPPDFWTPGPTAGALAFAFTPPDRPGSVLERLGPFPGEGGNLVRAQLERYYQTIHRESKAQPPMA